jgi:hypothetical protein
MAWLLSVPLMVAGVEGAHWLVYRVVYPDAYTRSQVLAASGHGYLNDAPTFFAIAGALGLCLWLARALSRPGRFGSDGQVSLMPFLLLAPLAFCLQECVEQLFVGGSPFAAVFEPTFLPGVLLQVPFAIVAFFIARWLLRVADRVRSILGGGPLVWVHEPALWFAVADLPRVTSLARGYGERGPPVAGMFPATLSASR